jgi:hypothetical protein
LTAPVAIIGGGIQGCSVAVELSMRGISSHMFDRRAELMMAASRWNEGKIHLGYLWAKDETHKTVGAALRHALAFRRKLAEYLGRDALTAHTSTPFVYAVLRDSQVAADAFQAHVERVDRMVAEALTQPKADYLGQRQVQRSMAAVGVCDDATVAWTVQTPEIAVNPHVVADALRERVTSDPSITVQCDIVMDRVRRREDGRFEVHQAALGWHGPFRAVVNCSWESRLWLDETIGLRPTRPWLLRYKLALHAAEVSNAGSVPSATLVLGPYGDVVNLGGGRLYMSWYPVTRLSSSGSIRADDPEEGLTDAERERIAGAAFNALVRHVPSLGDVRLNPKRIAVRGGFIVAWGATDVSDPASGLHKRHEVGVHSQKSYHSVDTGKYSYAPLQAAEVARRIEAEL